MSNSTPSTTQAYLHLHFLVVLWSFTAILGKLIAIPPVEIVFYRTLFAFVVLYGILKWRGQSLYPGRVNMLSILATGCVIALHWVLFFLGARVSNISICLAGMATTSLWTSLIEPLYFRRKIKVYEPVLGIVAIIGISVVFDAVIDQYLGFLIGVASALLASVFTIINGQLVKKTNHLVISFYQMLGACLCVLVFMPIYGHMFSSNGVQLALTTSDIIYLLILAVVCTVYAHSNSIKLMHKLSAFSLNLTVNLEPVYGILLAVAIFGNSEHMGPSFYWGTFIILCSVLLHPVLAYYEKRKIPKEVC